MGSPPRGCGRRAPAPCLSIDAQLGLLTLFRQLTHAGAPDTGWITVGIFLVFTALLAHRYLAGPAGHKLHARSRTA